MIGRRVVKARESLPGVDLGYQVWSQLRLGAPNRGVSMLHSKQPPSRNRTGKSRISFFMVTGSCNWYWLKYRQHQSIFPGVLGNGIYRFVKTNDTALSVQVGPLMHMPQWVVCFSTYDLGVVELNPSRRLHGRRVTGSQTCADARIALEARIIIPFAAGNAACWTPVSDGNCVMTQ